MKFMSAEVTTGRNNKLTVVLVILEGLVGVISGTVVDCGVVLETVVLSGTAVLETVTFTTATGLVTEILYLSLAEFVTSAVDDSTTSVEFKGKVLFSILDFASRETVFNSRELSVDDTLLVGTFFSVDEVTFLIGGKMADLF